MHVVIAGGGTVGHVQPAIALARALGGEDVSFIGTQKGAEARMVARAGLPFAAIEIKGFDRARPLSLLSLAPQAVRATAQARSLLRTHKPDVVVGMGGYVSLPVCSAARLSHTPVVLHEQNIVLGLANRVCKPVAARVAVSWSETLAAAGSHGVFTGNPVLPQVAHLDRAGRRDQALSGFGLQPSRKTLLVFGGSQGARRINQAAIGLADRWEHRDDRQVLHIAGASDFASTRAAVADRELPYKVVEFLDDMTDAYSAADLVMSRGGATTVAELTAVGLPAIVVPYPYHRDRQQERHAEILQAAGAALAIADSDTTTATVGDAADSLLGNEDSLRKMAVASLTLGRPDAAADLATVVRAVAA
jgi:UDP-N-acetylglucosamine--N-acetylmuramyl-(pentapeptide) pyrophosphoryl-undecaprenol N-acetylglucosamine transferase